MDFQSEHILQTKHGLHVLRITNLCIECIGIIFLQHDIEGDALVEDDLLVKDVNGFRGGYSKQGEDVFSFLLEVRLRPGADHGSAFFHSVTIVSQVGYKMQVRKELKRMARGRAEGP